MNKKRILFVIPNLSYGGAERQSVTIARLLASSGYEVSFITYFQNEAFVDLLEEAGIRVDSIICNGLMRVINVYHFIHRGHFDVVISFMQTPNFLNNFSALIGKKWKVITSIRATPRQTELQSIQGKIYNYFYRKSDIIVCNSDNTLKVFANINPVCGQKLKTIYNAVQLGKISSVYRIREDNRVNIVVAATVSNIKNPRGLLDAIILMNDDERKHLHIDWYGRRESVIGDHSEYDKVVECIEINHLQDVISLHDSTREIASIMNKADCVALFSRLEGLPNAICEGMMLGKPIIMTRCSDYDILVEDGKNGFLCIWDNPESIKVALIKLSNLSVGRLVEMGRMSKKKAQMLFSEDSISNKWIKIIEGN